MPGDAEGVPATLYRWIAPFLRVPQLTRGRIAASLPDSSEHTSVD
jgi:hypothetical protein